MTRKKVVILGGYGSFGSLIADRLTVTEADVVICGRDSRQGSEFARRIHANFVQCDVRDDISLHNAIRGAFLVINATGPYISNDHSVAEVCIAAKCNYIDLADGREYVKAFSRFDPSAKEHGVYACTGASTTPAITSLLVDELCKGLGKVNTIKIAMSPGTKNPAGVATFESILSYVGKPITIWRNGEWQDVVGWGEPEMIPFAKPIGRRRAQLCDIPDLDIFPERYHANTVIFKAGVELTVLNIALGFLGKLRKRIPGLNLPKLTRLLIFGSHFFKPFGTAAGGLQVWVTDSEGNQKSMAVIAPANGPRIPSSPAVILARKILRGEIQKHGAFPCVDFISLQETQEYLAEFGIEIQRVNAVTASR